VRGWLGFQEDLHEDVPGGAEPSTSSSRTLVTAAPEVEVDPTRRWRLLASCQVDVDIPGSAPAGSAGTAWGVGPLASAQYSPWRSTELRLTAARRTRFPTLKERFSGAFGLRVPNPGLRPESAWHIGLDGSYRLSPFLRLDASIYDAEVTDLIEVVSLGEGRDQMQNVATARLLGAELLLAVRPLRFLELQAGYSWLHARRTDGGPDDRLAYRPAHRALGSVVLTPWPWLEASALVRVFGPQDYDDPITRAWGVLGAYALLDARLEVRPHPVLALWVRGTNLVDTYCQSKVGFPDPGRVVWLGLKLTGE
jgi:iron complex outermembrane receptor protein